MVQAAIKVASAWPLAQTGFNSARQSARDRCSGSANLPKQAHMWLTALNQYWQFGQCELGFEVDKAHLKNAAHETGFYDSGWVIDVSKRSVKLQIIGKDDNVPGMGNVGFRSCLSVVSSGRQRWPTVNDRDATKKY